MKIQVPPPPPPSFATTSRALPPPPPPMGRAPPPPGRNDSFQSGPPLGFQQGSLLPGAGLSPVFTRQVQQATTPELKALASQLKMEMTLHRFSGFPGQASEAQRKLSYVEGQLHQREVKQEMVPRFQYERQAGGMSNEQLSGARSKEAQSLFVAQFRGDAAGVKEARAKLGILDAEMGKRQHELSEFQQSLGGMSAEQLDDVGSKLAEQFADVLFDPKATGAQKDAVFNKLAVLIGEHLKREVKSAISDAFFSK